MQFFENITYILFYLKAYKSARIIDFFRVSSFWLPVLDLVLVLRLGVGLGFRLATSGLGLGYVTSGLGLAGSGLGLGLEVVGLVNNTGKRNSLVVTNSIFSITRDAGTI